MIDEKARRTLEAVEAGLRREGLEGSVFLMPSGAVIAFTMTTTAAHQCRYNIGARPLRNQLRNALGNEKAELKSWFAALQATAGVPKPASIWHRPHLVVSEAMAAERLVTVFEHPERMNATELAEIAEQIGIYSASDLERRFYQATRRRLAERAVKHYEDVVQSQTTGTG